MKKSVWIILGIIAVLVVGIVVFASTKDKKDDPSDSPGKTTSDQSNSEESTGNGDVALAEATITYTNTGFEPETVTVSSGATITVVNQSDETLAFRSDPHPVHTENDELNIEDMPAGGTESFTVTETGTWGFHNHFDADKSGVIVVE